MVVLFPFAGTGQTYFNELHPGTFAYGNLTVLSDGYLLLGDSLTPTNRIIYSTKIDFKGNTVWNNHYGEHPLVFYSDNVLEYGQGGFIVSASVKDTAQTGLRRDIVVMAFDAVGENIWSHRIVHSLETLSRDLVKTQDGHYVIAGVTGNFGDITGDFYLVKIDSSSGEPLWEEGYGDPGVFEEGRSVIQTNDGGFILSGVKDMPNGFWDVWVVKTDSTGKVEWDKTYGEDFQDFGGYASLANDGNMVMAWNKNLTSSLSSTQLAISKIDVSNGDTIFHAIYEQFVDPAFMTKPVINSDGTIVCAGNHKPDGREIGLVVKVSPTGNLIWSREYFTRADVPNRIYDIKGTSDSGYVFCGSAFAPEQTGGLSKGWIVKLDCHGNDSITYYEPDSACVVYSNITYYQSPVNEDIKVFPNPATDHVTVEFPQGLKVEAIELINATGQSVFRVASPVNGQWSTVNHRLSTAHYPRGLYWLKVRSIKGITFAKKLVLR